jgi:polygalacturonase
LDQCSTVVFPGGGAYLTRPLEIRRSGLNIVIEPSAVVVVWGDMDTYNQTTGTFSSIFWSNTSFLVQDTQFSGGGVIDGQGWRWWPFGKTRPRPHLFTMQSCQWWSIDNITLRDSPSFHILARGDRLSVTRTRVEANLNECGGYSTAPNTDGINVGGTNVFISDVFVHNGDDCIPLGDADTLPAFVTARDTRNVIAENVHCECGTNSAVAIVGAGSTRISDAIFRNFTTYSLNQGAGMKIR